MLTSLAIRMMSTQKNKEVMKPESSKSSSPILRSIYINSNQWFPKMIPRVARFSWGDLVVYCEFFFVGLMIYIHFIDP